MSDIFFLPYSDLAEASAVCKLFYHLSRKNAGFVEKLSHSRMLFAGFDVHKRYRDTCLVFAAQLFHVFDKKFEEGVLLKAKEMILDRLFFSF